MKEAGVQAMIVAFMVPAPREKAGGYRKHRVCVYIIHRSNPLRTIVFPSHRVVTQAGAYQNNSSSTGYFENARESSLHGPTIRPQGRLLLGRKFAY